MKYINRIERISQDELGTIISSGLNGESAVIWDLLKDRYPLRLNIDGKPNLNKWCAGIYKQLPDENKIPSKKSFGQCLSYTSAAKVNEPFAVMLSTLQRWLERNPGVMTDKLEKDKHR